jgi:hypothetical protein
LSAWSGLRRRDRDRVGLPASTAEPADPADDVPAAGENEGVEGKTRSIDLGRLSWLITVIVLMVTVLVLFDKGDYGYAGATLAVAISAAINLF